MDNTGGWVARRAGIPVSGKSRECTKSATQLERISQGKIGARASPPCSSDPPPGLGRVGFLAKGSSTLALKSPYPIEAP